MAETHELRLKIDAGAAQSGAKNFKAAIASVRAAVKDLERDSNGAFLALKNMSPKVDVSGLKEASREAQNVATAQDRVTSASDRAAERIRSLAIQSANALRVSTDQASRLRDRLLSVGDTASLAKLEAGLDRLRMGLTNATTGLGVREARAAYADLASELNRTAREAERLNAIAVASARAEAQAADAARSHAAALERLAQRHDPLRAASKAYEQSLAEIQQLETAGVLSAGRAAQARENASQSLLAASAANTAYANTSRQAGVAAQQMGYQINDVFTMAALGASPMQVVASQIFQVTQAMEMAGGKAKALGSVRTALLGLLNPSTLAVGAVIGLTAALVSWGAAALSAEDATESFKRQLDTLSTLSTDLSATLHILEMDATQLAEKYGTAATRARELAIAQAELRRGEIIDALRAQVAELGFIETRYRQAQGAAALYSQGLTNIATDFKISRAEAIEFHDVLMGLSEAATFEEQRAALQAIVRHAEEAGVKLSQFPPELRAAAINMIDLSNESDALQQLLQRAADVISGATGQTSAWASAMSGVRVEIDAIASSLANIGGGVINNAAKRAELTALQAGKSVKEAAVARERFRREQEWAAREQSAASGIGGWLQRQAIGAERYQFEEGVRLDSQLDAARAATRKAASGSSGGSSRRVEVLGDESRQLERLIKQTNNRTFGLNQENAALRLLIDGQAETMEGAKLLAAAQAAGMSATDANTLAMVRQHDAAAKLNEQLQRLARDPVKDWIESVPTWKEAGRQIETQVFDSLGDAIAEFAQTGKMDFEKLGASILATATSVIADMAVKELINMLGGSIGSGGSAGFGFGDFLAGVFGAGSEGGYSESLPGRQVMPLAAFNNAPHFSEGTPNTSGIPSILHPNEAVIPLTKGRKVPVEMGDAAGGGTVINMPQTFQINTPDAESFRRSRDQIAADMARSGQRAMQKNG